MMDKNIFYLLLFAFLQQRAVAQSKDSTSYFVGYQSSGTWNMTGESRLLIFNNSLNLRLKRKDMGFNLNGSWLYGTQDKKLVNNDISSAVYVDLYKTWEHFNYWGLATYDRSYSLDLENRFQLGAGGAYDLVDKAYFLLNVSNGIIYEESQIQGDGDKNVHHKTVRNSLRLMYTVKWKELLVFNGTHFLQTSFARSRDYIIKSNSTIFIKVFKGIYLSGSIIYNRLNISARENLVTTFGINFEKRF